ncbi:MAG: HlyC/CorC family transporter [Tessaracoccus sp.]|uniref:hemolysin family protein n=1 Tax=Tessaracoccus sp. TaxID=1971211 RepID=UPI001EBD17E1|nr:hemolysin family protein [Tessaracoccus sp.]MBK7821681.1 HlyC/CorC family transporter [Tessaracoccus sp.]
MGADIALVFLFILVGGVFAAAEMAMVTLRESQIRQLATKGTRGRAIESLTSNPNLFLSSVQIGVTVSGFLSAAFGGATIAEALTPVFVRWGLPAPVAHPAALVLVTVAISYFSIVIGELTAKRLAMQRAEAFALALAPLVAGIARFTRPVIWFLDRSTNFLVRLLGGDPHLAKDQVSDEELRAMVSSSVTLGAEEQRIVDEVFDAGERTLREVMVPRTEVDFLPADMPIAQAYREVRGAAHSRYPVTDGGADRIVGFLHIRDLMEVEGPDRNRTVRSLAREVLSLPETVKILRALSSMRAARSHLAIVRDEYGGTAGIVTMEDLVEELIGDITDEYDEDPKQEAEVDEIDGLTTIEEFADVVGYVLPDGPYDTVAGYVMARLGALPQFGDEVSVVLAPDNDPEGEGAVFTFRVSELDGRRAARIGLVKSSLPEAATDV